MASSFDTTCLERACQSAVQENSAVLTFLVSQASRYADSGFILPATPLRG
jgi:hypothetical protein